MQHLREVLTMLQKEKLFVVVHKCIFMVSEVLFLGYKILGKGLQVDDTKIEDVR